MVKWERRLMERVRWISAAVRERRGLPWTIAALFIRIVAGPSLDGVSWIYGYGSWGFLGMVGRGWLR